MAWQSDFKRAERRMEVFGVIFFLVFMLFEGGVSVWTDPKTGCRYTNSEYGMPPLIGREGRPDCGGVQ